MRNKIFVVVIAVISLVAILWWPSSNTDDPSLSEENNPALPILENTKSTTSEVFYSPPTDAKSKSADTLDLKEPQLESQPESRYEAAIESINEARLEDDDRTTPTTYDSVPELTPTPEELASPEPYNEYETREEMLITNAETADPEMQNITQQLQVMRDAGLDEAAIREAEEKLIHLQQMTQRLHDQQSISKATDDSEVSP